MKKLLSMFLCTVLLFCVTIPSTSATSTQTQTFTFDDGYSVQVLATPTYIHAKDIDPAGNVISQTTLNRTDNTITFTNSNGIATKSTLSQYVIPDETQSLQPPAHYTKNTNLPSFSEVLLEHDFNSTIQSRSIYSEPITDDDLVYSGYGDGYYTLGSATMTYCSTPGYLYRKSAMQKHEAYRFAFSAGDAVSLVVSALLAAFSPATGLTSAIIAVLFPPAAGVLVNSFSGTVDYRNFHYNYRVRVNHIIYFTAERNEDYWVRIRDSGVVEYQYRRFNYGYSQSNFEMVKAGIDNYIEAQLG